MPLSSEQKDEFVENRYTEAIAYYWKTSRNNKRAYKLTRSLIVILGALVTLVAALSSVEFVNTNPFWDRAFTFGTPILAVALTIVAGFSQNFQWGAAWQDMVLAGQRLEKERDRFLLTAPEERDLTKEVALLNDLVLVETQGFFERILGGGRPPFGQPETDSNETTTRD